MLMDFRVIGIDEAGRGPLAGPVAVGAVLLPPDFDWTLLPRIDDSKRLAESARDEAYLAARELKRAGVIDYRVSLVGAATIDRIGIAPAVRLGVSRTLRLLIAQHELSPAQVAVKLDGALRAPAAFTAQETIIGGDGIEKSIGLASILAKVTRDRLMHRLARQYPDYGFEMHKGYGTKGHCERIMLHGLSNVHRRSFCGRLNA